MNLIKRGAGKNWTAVWMWQGKKYSRCTGVEDRRRAAYVAARFKEAQTSGRLDLLEQTKLRRTSPMISEIMAKYPGLALCRPETTRHNVTEMKRVLAMLGMPESSTVASLGADFSTKFANAAKRRGLGDTGIATTLRCARSLFSKRMLACYGLQEPPAWLSMPNPKPTPTEGFQPISRSAWVKIVRGVHKNGDPDIYRAFLLMARCGMGNDEVINARGTWLVNNGIRVESRDGWKPKSHNRNRTIPIRARRFKRFFSEFAGRDVPLVLNGRRKIYRDLTPIIRKALPGRQKAAYELRKLAGSVVATRDGIYAAAKFLGDRTDTVERYYAALLKPLKPL